MTEEYSMMPKKLSISLNPVELTLKIGSPISSFSVLQSQPAAPSWQVIMPDHHKESARQFKEYSNDIEGIIGRVDLHQLQQLKNKYRFYLSKVDKLSARKQQLILKFNGLPDLVQNSEPVKQESKSIIFIKKVSEQTDMKLDQLFKKVGEHKQQKKDYRIKISSLKQVIKKKKDLFFELKRMQTKISNEIMAQKNRKKLANANTTFKAILNQKNRNRKKQGYQAENDHNFELYQMESRLSLFRNVENKHSAGKSNVKECELPQLWPSGNQNRRSFQTIQTDDGQRAMMRKNQSLRTPRAAQSKNGGQQKGIQMGGKNQLIISQLNKVHEMRNELLRLQYQCKGKSMGEGDFQKCMQCKNKKSSREYARTNGQSKECMACEYQEDRKRKLKQKYSLHLEDMQKFKTKVGKGHKLEAGFEETPGHLLIGDDTLHDIEQVNRSRAQFIQLGPQAIIEKILQADKIGEVLSLMGKYNINNGRVEQCAKMFR